MEKKQMSCGLLTHEISIVYSGSFCARQGNMQRCKLVMDQVTEARDTMMKVLDHKEKVLKLLNKNGAVKKSSKLKRKERAWETDSSLTTAAVNWSLTVPERAGQNLVLWFAAYNLTHHPYMRLGQQRECERKRKSRRRSIYVLCVVMDLSPMIHILFIWQFSLCIVLYETKGSVQNCCEFVALSSSNVKALVFHLNHTKVVHLIYSFLNHLSSYSQCEILGKRLRFPLLFFFLQTHLFTDKHLPLHLVRNEQWQMCGL